MSFGIGVSMRPMLSQSQRRLRHLRGLIARNLKPTQHQILPNPFYTLHLGPPNEEDELPPPFYTSEVIRNSLNPNWRSITMVVDNFQDVESGSTKLEEVELVQSSYQNETVVTICVWDIPTQTTGTSDLMAPKLLTRVIILMSNLQFIGDQRKFGSLPPNTVLLELVDGYYRVGLGPATPNSSLSVSAPTQLLSNVNPFATLSGSTPLASLLKNSEGSISSTSLTSSSLTSPLTSSAPATPSLYRSASMKTSTTNLLKLATDSGIRNLKIGTSFSLPELIKLVSLHRQLKQSSATTNHYYQQINKYYIDNEQYHQRLRHCDMVKLRVQELRRILVSEQQKLQQEQNSLTDTRNALIPRTHTASRAEISLLASQKMLADDLYILKQDRELCDSITRSALIRKWSLLSQLRSIYIISSTPSSSAPAHFSTNEGKSLAINGFRLPNSDFTGCDEEQVATALGAAAHVVFMISKYLGIPLRYPVVPMCSRSNIRDDVSSQASPKFPLYSRGVDKTRFEYGVFLLNKDVEQLLNSQNLEVVTLRHTLSNLQILLSYIPPDVKAAQQQLAQAAQQEQKIPQALSQTQSIGSAPQEHPQYQQPETSHRQPQPVV